MKQHNYLRQLVLFLAAMKALRHFQPIIHQNIPVTRYQGGVPKPTFRSLLIPPNSTLTKKQTNRKLEEDLLIMTTIESIIKNREFLSYKYYNSNAYSPSPYIFKCYASNRKYLVTSFKMAATILRNNSVRSLYIISRSLKSRLPSKKITRLSSSCIDREYIWKF